MAVDKEAAGRIIRIAAEENGPDCIFVRTLKESVGVPGMTVRKLRHAVARQKKLRSSLRAVGLLEPKE